MDWYFRRHHRDCILVGWSPIPFTSEVIIAILLSYFQLVSYGFAGVYAKKAFEAYHLCQSPMDNKYGATYSFPFTLLNLPKSTSVFTPIVGLSIVGVAILCTFIGTILLVFLLVTV